MIAIFPPAHTYIPKGVWGSSFEAGNKMKWKAHATFWAVQEKTNTNPQKEHKSEGAKKRTWIPPTATKCSEGQLISCYFWRREPFESIPLNWSNGRFNQPFARPSTIRKPNRFVNLLTHRLRVPAADPRRVFDRFPLRHPVNILTSTNRSGFNGLGRLIVTT